MKPRVHRVTIPWIPRWGWSFVKWRVSMYTNAGTLELYVDFDNWRDALDYALLTSCYKADRVWNTQVHSLPTGTNSWWTMVVQA